MTTISIVPESSTTEQRGFRAVSGQRKSSGKTPGEALDAMTAQMNDAESGTLVVVQQMRPDRFFTAAQQQRLGDLMQRWRTARDGGMTFSAEEQSELEELTTTVLEASRQRAEALLSGMQP